MNLSLLYNPYKLIERLAIELTRRRRLGKLKNKPGAGLQLGHIDTLELLEIIKKDQAINNRPTIFDIGSNTGTWTLLAKSIWPSATIHAFEPLTEHINAFKDNCSALAFVFLHQYCVGSADNTATLNISSYSDSSSLLDATPLEFEYFRIKKEKEQSVEVKRLDRQINEKVVPVPEIIKLDIQGFELEALKGIGDWLHSVKYIICEVSFKEYYYGQPQFLDIAVFLSGQGFQLLAFGNNTPIGAELNQIDVLFKRIK